MNCHSEKDIENIVEISQLPNIMYKIATASNSKP